MTAYMQASQHGHVVLVGAGPGSADLLTVRGAAALRSADVVVYDRLVSDEILALAPPAALRVDVGKTPGGPSALQADIHRVMIEHARAGRTVVRLKGGDPFVFGRGNEELDACAGAGVPCEVVPGISSALAAPLAAGIPVTARGVARSFAVVTARGGDDATAYDVPFASLAGIDTVVVLMGRADLDRIARELIAAGRDPSTPAALIERATCPDQRVIRAALAEIAQCADEHAIASPAVLVVGPTAAYGASAQAGPLSGRRILVTRPTTASAQLVAGLRARGAVPIDAPLIRIEYLESLPIDSLADIDWIVLTSLHGVRGFARALTASGLDSRALAGVRIATVGPKTAEELERVLFVRADLVPQEYRAKALVAEMVDAIATNETVLFPCGTLARDEVIEGLRASCAEVRELLVYATLPQPPSAGAMRAIGHGLDAVLLYSPSAARTLASSLGALGATPVVCVGPTTAQAAHDLGFPNVHVARRYGDDGVLELLEHLLAEDRAPDSTVHDPAGSSPSGTSGERAA
jgi:uroporphyrinogen III methyltransferase / synthase